MKRNYIYAALLYAFTVAVTPAIAGQPQQEKIGRGVVAVKTDEGVFVSWRYLGTAVFEREYNTQGLPRLVISGLEALPKGSYTLTISQDGKPLPAKKLFKW